MAIGQEAWRSDIDRLCRQVYGEVPQSSDLPVPQKVFLRMQGDQLSFDKPKGKEEWGYTWDRLKRGFLRSFTSQYELSRSLRDLDHLIASARTNNALSPSTDKANVDAQIRALSHVLDELKKKRQEPEQPVPEVPQQAAPQPTPPEPRLTRPIYGGIVEQREPGVSSPTGPQPSTMAEPVAPVFWRAIFHKRVDELGALNKKTMSIYAEAPKLKQQSKQDFFPDFNPPEMNELIQAISDLRITCFSPACTNFDDRLELLQTLHQNLEAKYELWKRRLALHKRYSELEGRAAELLKKIGNNEGVESKMKRCAAVADSAMSLLKNEQSLERVKRLEADADALDALLKKIELPVQGADTYVQTIQEVETKRLSLQKRLDDIERSTGYQLIQTWGEMADRLPEDAKSRISTCLEMYKLASKMTAIANDEDGMKIVEGRIAETLEEISSLNPLLKDLEKKYAQYSECTLDKYKALCRLKNEEPDFEIEELSRFISLAKGEKLQSREDLKVLAEKTSALEKKNQEILEQFDKGDMRGARVVAYLGAVNDIQESNNILLSFFPQGSLGDSFLKTAYTDARKNLLSLLSKTPTADDILKEFKTKKESNKDYAKQHLTEQVWQDWHAGHHIRKPTMTRDQFLQLDARTQGNYLWEIQSGQRSVQKKDKPYIPGPEDTRYVRDFERMWM